ncbi:histidine kinase [Chitinophagaceae bacterium MMS25-I14]
MHKKTANYGKYIPELYLAIILIVLQAICACDRPKPSGTTNTDINTPDTLLKPFRQRMSDLYAYNKAHEVRQLLDSMQPYVETHCTPRGKIEFACMQAAYYMNTKTYDSARLYYNKALAILPAKDSTGDAAMRVELLLGSYFRAVNQPDSALFYVRNVYNKTLDGDTAKHQLACVRMAEIYSALSDKEMVRKYAREGFYIAPRTPAGKSTAVNLAQAFDDLGQTDSAIYMYQTYVLPDSMLEGQKGYIVRMLGLGSLYRKKGLYDSALTYYFKALNHATAAEIKDPTIFNDIAIVYSKQKKYSSASQYFDSSLKYINDESQNPMLRFEVLFSKAQNLYYLGKVKEGFELMDSAVVVYVQMTDSSYRDKARELETEYAVKSKDEAIKLLSLKNTAAKREAAQQKIIVAALVIALLLLIITGVVIFRRRQLAAQLQQAELEQRLLRTQMEPHFIFNSLAVLQSQIRAGEQEKASKYLNQFARLLRSSLENSREAFVPLNEEVDALQNYLSLQAMRFEEVFNYHVDAYPGYEEDDISIPPMLLQPFVENAIHHGVQSLGRKGNIEISIRKQTETLICTISDDGKGYNPDTTSSGHKSLSTIITQERLAILSRQTGRQASLHISSRASQQGTIVELVVPYKRTV